MEFELSLSVLLSLGGVVASVASAVAIVKTKVSSLENDFEQTRKELKFLASELSNYQSEEAVKVALLESNQRNYDRELAEVKTDIKTIMANVQEIKEAVIKATKKGDI